MLYARWLSLASVVSRRPWRVVRVLGRTGKLVARLFSFLAGVGKAAPPPQPARSHARARASAVPPWRLNALGWLLALAVPVALAALGIGCGPSAAYLKADRATYDAIAPEYAAYVDADPALSESQRQRRRRTLDAWKLRLDRADQASDVP